MNRSRIVNGVLIAVLGLALLFAASQLFTGVRQVSNPAASTLDFEGGKVKFLFLPEMPKSTLFILLAGFTVVSLGGMAVGLLGLFRNLHQQVSTAKTDKPRPTNPLSYDTYGHVAGAVLVGGLTLLGWAVMNLGVFGSLLPVAGGEEAAKIDTLFQIEFFFISLFFGLVAGLFIHFSIYYRAREGDTSDGLHFHSHMKLEVVWTIIPAIIVTVLGILAGVWLSDISEAKEGEVAVQVVGRQWGWQFEYPVSAIPEDMRPDDLEIESFVSPELVLMINQPYLFEMTSVDVLHAFWVPELRIKRDVTPGTLTELRVTPNIAGEYQVICSELCGTSHWSMVASVRVVDEAGYRAWIEETLAAMGNPVLAGQNWYSAYGCAGCHSLDGSRLVGPSWLNLYGSERNFTDGSSAIADAEYLRNAILNPGTQVVAGYQPGLMPQNYRSQLSDVQIDQLIAFMMSLSDTGRAELEAQGVELEGATADDGMAQ